MKVLVAGLGSIGQRHVRNLRALRGGSVDILAYRARGLPHLITDEMTIAGGASVEAAYGIRACGSLDAALAERPDAVFVCNPTSLHMDTALAAARAGCHLFIEKPLSHSRDGVGELVDIVQRRALVATVGYQLRFHPVLLRAQELLCQGAIGRVHHVRAEFGEYLPSAHPYEDYRQSYAARAALGGGVILCYIHEVDYLCWLFGTPTRVFATGGRLGELEIDVEDTAVASFEYEREDGARPMVIQLQLSFLQRPASRMCTIVGETGTLHLDLLAPALAITTADETRREDVPPLPRNDLFRRELASFLSAIAGDVPPAVSLREAAQSLHVALAMRESLTTGRVIEVPA